MLPNTSLACVKEKSVPGNKIQKQRITILTVAIATSSFVLSLTCIGKAKKPRALKNIASTQCQFVIEPENCVDVIGIV